METKKEVVGRPRILSCEEELALKAALADDGALVGRECVILMDTFVFGEMWQTDELIMI